MNKIPLENNTKLFAKNFNHFYYFGIAFQSYGSIIKKKFFK